MTAYAASIVACTLITPLDELTAGSPPGSKLDAALDGPKATDASDGSTKTDADATSPITDASVPPSFTVDGDVLPGPPPSTCSVGTSQDAQAQTLTFENNSSSKVGIWWVNQSCREVFYYDLDPTDSRSQNTYVTHVWRAREATTFAIVRDVAARPNSSPTTVKIP